MRLIQKKRSNADVVTLDEVKNMLRLDGFDEECLMSTSDDKYLQSLILSATDYCENYQKRAYLTQEWALILDNFVRCFILPRGNIQEIKSVTVKKKDGTTEQSEDYAVNLDTGKFYFEKRLFDLHPADPITIDFVCGFKSKDKILPRTKQAIMFLISHWYENRVPIDETRTAPQEIAFTLSALLDGDKWVIV